MKKLFTLFSVVVSTAVAQNTLDAYEPITKNGTITDVEQKFIQIPSISQILSATTSAPIVYDSNNITLAGWSQNNLEFINTLEFDSNGVQCSNCEFSNDDQLAVTEISGFGECVGGFCEYQDSDCYFNVLGAYWYKCIPEILNAEDKVNKDPVSLSDIDPPVALFNVPASPDSENEAKELAVTIQNPVALSNEAPPVIAQINSESGCSISVSEFVVSSINTIKNYDFKNPINIPCTSSDFSFEFDVNTTSDLFVAITDSLGYYGNNGRIETYLGFTSEEFQINKGKSTPPTTPNTDANVPEDTSSPFQGHVAIKYTSNVISLWINGENEVSYNVKNFTPADILIAPFTGTATITNFVFSCSSSDSCPTSASSESNTCGTTSTVGSFSVTSSPFTKMYNFNNPIVIPCATSDFTFDFDVDSQSDLFVVVTGPNGYSVSEDLVEAYFGFEDDLFLINKGKNNLTASNPASAPASSNAFKGKVTVKYTSSNLSLLVNGVSKVNYNVKGMTLSKVFFAPFTGKATISGGLFNCVSIDSCPEPSSDSSESPSSAPVSSTSASSESSTCGTTSTV
ncbi:hypothetical protein AYI69_g6925, partial [Smittium culicis]